MSAVIEKIRTEPAVVTGVVVAVLTLLVSFGVPISEDQRAAIVGFVSAGLALVGAFAVRAQVTPLVDPKDNAGNALTPDGYVGLHEVQG